MDRTFSNTTRGGEAPWDSRVEAVGELSLWQSLKKRKRIVFYCIGMSTAILMYGYDYVIVGTTASMPSFQ